MALFNRLMHVRTGPTVQQTAEQILPVAFRLLEAAVEVLASDADDEAASLDPRHRYRANLKCSCGACSCFMHCHCLYPVERMRSQQLILYAEVM
jgi:hypothetical protein